MFKICNLVLTSLGQYFARPPQSDCFIEITVCYSLARHFMSYWLMQKVISCLSMDSSMQAKDILSIHQAATYRERKPHSARNRFYCMHEDIYIDTN